MFTAKVSNYLRNMRSVGKIYEEKVCKYLEDKNYTILERNFYIPGGEIDIIARDGKYLVFIEVKKRKSSEYGYPSQVVNEIKQNKIIKTAIFYLKQKNLKVKDIRFDVVAIVGENNNEEMEHIQNAFTCEGYYF